MNSFPRLLVEVPSTNISQIIREIRMLMIAAFPKPFDLLVSRNCPDAPWKAFSYNLLWKVLCEEVAWRIFSAYTLCLGIIQNSTTGSFALRGFTYELVRFFRYRINKYDMVGNERWLCWLILQAKGDRSQIERIPIRLELRRELMILATKTLWFFPQVLVAFKPTEEHLRQVRNLRSDVGAAALRASLSRCPELCATLTKKGASKV